MHYSIFMSGYEYGISFLIAFLQHEPSNELACENQMELLLVYFLHGLSWLAFRPAVISSVKAFRSIHILHKTVSYFIR